MILPNDIKLEQRFLCLCHSLNIISLDIKHTDFYDLTNQGIYRAFCYGEFEATESTAKRYNFNLEKYFRCLESGEFSATNFNFLVKKVLEISERRRAIVEAQQTIANMTNYQFEVKTHLTDRPVSPKDCADEVIDEWNNFERLRLNHFWAISEKFKNFSTGHVLLLSGMSGTGKTGFGIQLCDDIAESNGEKWLFVSLEMPKKSIFERIMKTNYFMNNQNSTPYYANEFFEKNKNNKKYFEVCIKNNMYIIDTPSMDIKQIGNIIKSQCERDRTVRTVLIDYAQLISHTTDEYKALTEISRLIPQYAKKYSVRIILLTQLTKDCYDNARPTPKSIKGAGGLFDNSDEVWCLFRDKNNAMNDLHVLHWKSRHNGIFGETKLTINGLYAHCELKDDGKRQEVDNF